MHAYMYTHSSIEMYWASHRAPRAKMAFNFNTLHEGHTRCHTTRRVVVLRRWQCFRYALHSHSLPFGTLPGSCALVTLATLHSPSQVREARMAWRRIGSIPSRASVRDPQPAVSPCLCHLSRWSPMGFCLEVRVATFTKPWRQRRILGKVRTRNGFGQVGG